MSKALLCIIAGILLLGLGVYFLLLREKMDYLSDDIKKKQHEIEKISNQLDIINIQLKAIEKPLFLVNKYSNNFINFLKKYEK